MLSDILQAVDLGHLAALVLLDLSAAFDRSFNSVAVPATTFGIGDTALY